jgi:hypothetical protein
MYTFGEFTLRPSTSYDMPLAQLWTTRDLDHYKTTPATFWIEQSPETNSFLLLSQDGEPVFFFRIDERPDKQVEIHIQFSEPDALRQRVTRRGVTQGFSWLEKMLTESGFEGYYFHSRNPQLIFFCQQRLGFEWDGTKLYRNFRRKNGEGNDGGSRQERQLQNQEGGAPQKAGHP